jgi:hypothetical protein
MDRRPPGGFRVGVHRVLERGTRIRNELKGPLNRRQIDTNSFVIDGLLINC